MRLNPSVRRSLSSVYGMLGPRHLSLGLLGLVVSAASIWLLLAATDASALQRTLVGADWTFVGLAVMTLAVSMVIRTARWKVILPPTHGRRATVISLLPLVLIGYAVNALVPMRIGDLFRGVAASRRFRTGTPEALGSVGLERILDAGALAGVAAVASIGSQVPDWLAQGGFLIAAAAVTAVVVVYLIGIRGSARRIAMNATPTMFWRTWTGLRASPRKVAASSLLSTLAWGVDGITVWIVARSLGIEIGWEASMLIAAGAALAAILPSAPASIGTFHLAGTAVGVAMGLEAGAALSVVVLWHATTFGSLLIAGSASALLIGASRREFQLAGGHAGTGLTPPGTVREVRS